MAKGQVFEGPKGAVLFKGRLRASGSFAFDLQFCVRGICVQGGRFFVSGAIVQGAIVFKGQSCSRGNRVQRAIVF